MTVQSLHFNLSCHGTTQFYLPREISYMKGAPTLSQLAALEERCSHILMVRFFSFITLLLQRNPQASTALWLLFTTYVACISGASRRPLSSAISEAPLVRDPSSSRRTNSRAKRCLRNNKWANAIPLYDACVTEQEVGCSLQEVVRSPPRNHWLTGAWARIELQAIITLATVF